jgi:hydrogenase maturation factor/predicted fused transcriptional regulator/phosphomethylpyrimidine kinase
MPLYRKPTLDAVPIEIRGRVVVSHNPALGTPLETLGFFAFHYSVSNLAVRFAHPEYIVVDINLPPKSTEKELRVIAKGLGDEAKRYGVKVAGGHTGVYKGLSIPLVSVTCLGRQLRRPVPPSLGDLIVIVGQVGAEAVWLQSLSEESKSSGGGEETWRKLTPLPASLRLARIKNVKLMHDVSEGGVATALYEIAEDTGLKLDVKSDSMHCHEEAQKLGVDLLRIPSYGVLIAVVSSNAIEKISRLCEEMGYFWSEVGKIKKGSGAFVDGTRIKTIKRTSLDQIYGSFRREPDKTIQKLEEALTSLERCTHIHRLIPQVGTSMVYSRHRPESLNDIAGLSGRVVVSQGKPKVCGKVTYGGSKHLGAVLFETSKLNPKIKAAVNVKGRDEVAKVLKSMGIKVCRVPSIRTKAACPVATFIKESQKLCNAYYHPGSHGIEPSIVILSETPQRLLDTLVKASEYVRNNTSIQ